MYIIDVTKGDNVSSQVVKALDIALDIARQTSLEGALCHVYQGSYSGNGGYKVRAILCAFERGKRSTFKVLDTLGRDGKGVSLTELELYFAE